MNDEILTKLEQEKAKALNDTNTLYKDLLNDNTNLYNQQNNYANTYETTQNEMLDKTLDFNIKEIERNKELAKENKAEEERKALNDYTKYINPYGYTAENLAERGLGNSGVSEATNTAAYQIYQNRLSKANKVLQNAIVSYDRDIEQARLNNDTQKAQNALAKLQMQIEFSNNYFNNKTNLGQNQLSTTQSITSDYYNKYLNEKQRQDALKQWETEMAFKEKQAAQEQANWEKEYALAQAKASASNSGGYIGTVGGLTDNLLVGGNNKNYNIVSTDANGWGLTDLKQIVQNSNGEAKTVEVYENPQGELLYWNPYTNGWDIYNGISQYENKNLNDFIKSIPKNMTTSEITNYIKKNLSSLSRSDVEYILKKYGYK